MHNIFEGKSSRIGDHDDHVASSFRRPSDEDEVEIPKVLYTLLSFFKFFFINCSTFTFWQLDFNLSYNSESRTYFS